MTIFQASDLATKRTEVLQAARDGKAVIRDPQGQGLVMLPERKLQNLEKYSQWSVQLERLRRIVNSSRRPSVAELGELAWLRVFDNEDLESFCDDLSDQLIACSADGDYSQLDQMIKEWKITAGQLEDPLRKRILLRNGVDPAELTDAVPLAEQDVTQ
ncbi:MULTISPECIES: hypothetical protein [unclassified Bifidobacterium]|uniref:hypothetical protein n=1 Tax=unclassified Bifidobacterium TaxID=2608897 RepID=UPI00112CE734|nr:MULTISPECIES: hypothetical protein [unclassified Bifidobacterium]TPF77654.1 hypothetical protein BW09_08640 [Bifidobacterium sp. UTCIF-1]TPF79952.1 hypothetical protein BW08_07435 [Bifidobacterium sp. UTCIF-24]TPF81792.1 hypothetical protein BW12_08075 [Bifidobacterium sp. UTCIF-3]TPF83681.1 hypothetical protein BW07_08660 [Bifidobacterium sp. UTCIF-36]TPF88666.1 hypothetical protein BW10_08520 [Bifidobacterium sp. UTBIF-56]